MIKVEYIADYQLSPEDLATHGDGHNLLKVFHNGKLIMTQTDGGEPEDQSFFRDWNWVKDALIKMYEIGKTEGAKEIASLSADIDKLNTWAYGSDGYGSKGGEQK